MWDVEALVQGSQRLEPDLGGGPPRYLLVPTRVRFQVLQWGHSSRLAVHPGIHRTKDGLARCFWWPGMEKDMWEFVAAYVVCACNKSSQLVPARLLHPLPVPSQPWRHIALDFVTGLPPSEGHTAILVVVDRFLKAAHFIPLPKLPSALETAKLVVDHVFRVHGLPQDIVSDQGPQFISKFWRAFCSLLGASVSLSSGFYLEINDKTERINLSLENTL